MKLYQLLQSYDFNELYPELALMFPPARKQKDRIRKLYEELIAIPPVESKKSIRYELMHDPDTEEEFYGADDSCFASPWGVIMGKEVKKEQNVNLSEAEIAANCLLNIMLIGYAPKRLSIEVNNLRNT